MPAGVAFSHEGLAASMPGEKAGETASVPLPPAAVQEQLGLKLEQKRPPVDVIVIDKPEKVPTEN